MRMSSCVYPIVISVLSYGLKLYVEQIQMAYAVVVVVFLHIVYILVLEKYSIFNCG